MAVSTRAHLASKSMAAAKARPAHRLDVSVPRCRISNGHAGADSEKILEVWNLVGDAAPYVTVSQELFFKRAGEAGSRKAENLKLRKENCTRGVLYCPLCLSNNPAKHSERVNR